MRLFTNLILTAVFIGIFPQTFDGQKVYGVSDAVYDKKTKMVYGISKTYMDYISALYYDAAVTGALYDEQDRLSSDTKISMDNEFTAAVYTTADSRTSPDIVFGVYADHFLITHFWFINPLAKNPDNDEQNELFWHDLLGFSVYGGSQSLSWRGFSGSERAGRLSKKRSYNLGTTFCGVVTDSEGK